MVINLKYPCFLNSRGKRIYLGRMKIPWYWKCLRHLFLFLIGFSTFFHPCNFSDHLYCTWLFIYGYSIKSSRWVNKWTNSYLFFISYSPFFFSGWFMCVDWKIVKGYISTNVASIMQNHQKATHRHTILNIPTDICDHSKISKGQH